jgi:hypothetical protein
LEEFHGKQNLAMEGGAPMEQLLNHTVILMPIPARNIQSKSNIETKSRY